MLRLFPQEETQHPRLHCIQAIPTRKLPGGTSAASEFLAQLWMLHPGLHIFTMQALHRIFTAYGAVHIIRMNQAQIFIFNQENLAAHRKQRSCRALHTLLTAAAHQLKHHNA